MRISDWSSDVCSSDLDQVGEPRERVAPPDVEQPFAADRRLDQYVDDDRARQRWPRHDQPLDLPIGNDRQFDRIERLNRMIGAGQIERLKIARVARQLERDDLPPAVAGHFMPIGETRKEDGANVTPLAFTTELGRATCRERVDKYG